METPLRLAAIDLGTVTSRLLVADVDSSAVREVERSTDITHLGHDLQTTGRLDEAAIRRVTDVVSRYVSRISSLGVERTVAVATSAARDAANSDLLLARLADAGVVVNVISGDREARLSFAGAVQGRSGADILVVDCGGGSTELVLGEAGGDGSAFGISAMRSVDVGSRRMTELHLHGDPPHNEEVRAARKWAASALRPFFDGMDRRPQSLIAVAGTATSLAAIDAGLEVYDATVVHGYELTGARLADLVEMLAALPLAKRREVVGLHPERAGVIVAGALILETTLALAGLDRFVVSEHDILYGILWDTYRDLRESGS
jgi:exopolyphosphatase/guanosine-5'-triphosphate,3'-diphosphate pyrophosphatase